MIKKLKDALAQGNVYNWGGGDEFPLTQEVKENSMFLFSLANALYKCEATVEPTPNGTLSIQWESDKFIGAAEIGRTRLSAYGKSEKDGLTILIDGKFELND